MIWTRSGGAADGPLLVLLHGLGGTAEVWRGVEALLPEAWAGGWLLVDLPGHGRSPHVASYSFADQARLVAEALPTGRDLVLLGHSMGGMVALALAGFDDGAHRVRRVIGFSIKTWWPEHQVLGMQAQSTRPARIFATRAEAVERYLMASGLQGLADPASPVHEAGIARTDEGWRIAQDMRTFDFGVPDMEALVSAAPCPITLGRGAEDLMIRPVNYAHLAADHGVDLVVWDGLGHNPHVEDPAAVVAIL